MSYSIQNNSIPKGSLTSASDKKVNTSQESKDMEAILKKIREGQSKGQSIGSNPEINQEDSFPKKRKVITINSTDQSIFKSGFNQVPLTPVKSLRKEQTVSKSSTVRRQLFNNETCNNLGEKLSLEEENTNDLNSFSEFKSGFNQVPLTPVKSLEKEQVVSKSSTVRRQLFNIDHIELYKNEVSPSVSCFRTLFLQAETGNILIDNRNFKISPFAEGSYMKVYEISSKESIYPSIPNSDIIIKFYNEDKSKFKEKKINSFLETSIKNYFDAQKLNISIATIHNIHTAQKDGFFIQKKIPSEINIKNKLQIDQLRHFFITSLKSKTVLDLHPKNLRVQEDGTVTLIDFVENEKDGVLVFIRHALYQWTEKFAKEHQYNEAQTRDFLNNLTNGFDTYGYDIGDNEALILDKIFLKVQVKT